MQAYPMPENITGINGLNQVLIYVEVPLTGDFSDGQLILLKDLEMPSTSSREINPIRRPEDADVPVPIWENRKVIMVLTEVLPKNKSYLLRSVRDKLIRGFNFIVGTGIEVNLLT